MVNDIRRKYIQYEIVEKKQVNEKDIYTFVISSEKVDVVGDSMYLQGGVLDEFDQNSVVFYNHDSNSPPIGLGQGLFIKDNKLYSDVWLHGLTEHARDIKKLVDNDVIKSASIGFEVLESEERPFTEEETIRFANRPWIKNVTIIKKWILKEWSIVNLPANTDAMREKQLKDLYMKTNDETKAGRTISQANCKKLNDAHDTIEKGLNILKEFKDIGLETDEGKSQTKGDGEYITVKQYDKDITEILAKLYEISSKLDPMFMQTTTDNETTEIETSFKDVENTLYDTIKEQLTIKKDN